MSNVVQQRLFEDEAAELGRISIRVFVLPPKKKGDAHKSDQSESPLDLEEGEDFLVDKSSTPVGSYLESSRGKRCVVFLVNGQRQDFLDNSFIVNELGFKYLRNRMIITVDVDELTPETIGRLMQSSRQGFFKGEIYEAIKRRVISTLKNDPDLERLEQEAESQIAELQAGDAKVKATLDQLIESHHNFGWHLTEGDGAPGDSSGTDGGLFSIDEGNVVSLFSPNRGEAGEYPVLIAQPPITSMRLNPNQTRTITVISAPLNAWPALASLSVRVDGDAPELSARILQLPDSAELSVEFKEPPGFDPDNYPVRSKVIVTGRFNGIEGQRQIALGVLVRPDQQIEEPALVDAPSELFVTSRQPVKIRRNSSDTHVRLRWNGRDDLLGSDDASWRLSARLIAAGREQPRFTFSDPIRGRFDLLIQPKAEWTAGEQLTFEVLAQGPDDQSLSVLFNGEVVEPPAKPEPKEPRIIEGAFPTGASRRPPYELVYIDKSKYDEVPCWSEANWTDNDPGCFLSPTETAPLRIILNQDMAALQLYRNLLIKEKKAESEIERRVTKYSSHVAFHLYQMHMATRDQHPENPDEAEARMRHEVRRVAMTLLKLMEVSR